MSMGFKEGRWGCSYLLSLHRSFVRARRTLTSRDQYPSRSRYSLNRDIRHGPKEISPEPPLPVHYEDGEEQDLISIRMDIWKNSPDHRAKRKTGSGQGEEKKS